MKIRIGFVSNSSSSSFCAFGICIERDTDSLKELGMTIEVEATEDTEIDLGEMLYDESEKLGLRCHYDSYSDDAYIGLSYPEMRDYETKKEFEDRAKVTIKKLLPKITDDKFSWIEESWSQ